MSDTMVLQCVKEGANNLFLVVGTQPLMHKGHTAVRVINNA